MCQLTGTSAVFAVAITISAKAVTASIGAIAACVEAVAAFAGVIFGVFN